MQQRGKSWLRLRHLAVVGRDRLDGGDPEILARGAELKRLQARESLMPGLQAPRPVSSTVAAGVPGLGRWVSQSMAWECCAGPFPRIGVAGPGFGDKDRIILHVLYVEAGIIRLLVFMLCGHAVDEALGMPYVILRDGMEADMILAACPTARDQGGADPTHYARESGDNPGPRPPIGPSAAPELARRVGMPASLSGGTRKRARSPRAHPWTMHAAPLPLPCRRNSVR